MGSHEPCHATELEPPHGRIHTTGSIAHGLQRPACRTCVGKGTLTVLGQMGSTLCTAPTCAARSLISEARAASITSVDRLLVLRKLPRLLLRPSDPSPHSVLVMLSVLSCVCGQSHGKKERIGKN